ncbi:Heterokaryon incompatibility protein 6, OR allele [Colletotrichum siamense]|nr:Heterokaryon incompatibility protein 6, OR allele [Colletotrichum siamense]KAF4868934.1 Heterokaryon incompatibility protein 6, OR allele [Colletotrichum siamense]
MPSLYEQLELSDPTKQIRLLRLEPSPTETDEYAFSMGVYDFQENNRPSFIAISYTWGAPVPLLSVVINGFRMEVHFNCWYALWQMRHHGHTSNTSFWIDSLCINQDDDDEKGHQVTMMGDIFSSASSVAASLGTGESLGNVRETLASGDEHEILKLRDRFDQLAYFDRVWVKQEIVLAKDISMFCGLETLSWGQFDQAVKARSSRSRNGRNDLFRQQRLEKHSVSLQLCNHRSQVNNTSTLMDLVVKYETAKASVAADKIYALLSLLPQTDPIRQNLTVTYEEATWFPLFQTLVRLLYSHYQDHNLEYKHSVLCIIRDSLEISGLDEDVSAFFESQAYHPLDARSFYQESVTVKVRCLHVLNDENSEGLDHEELKVGMNQTEPSDARRELGISRHDDKTDKSHLCGHSHDILPELHIPPQLKSLRTLHNLPGRKLPGSFVERALRKRLLVNSDVRPGDLLGILTWGAEGHDTKPRWDLAHVILRRTTVADKSGSQDCGVPLEDETRRRRPAFFLHSWAIPLREKCTMLSELDRREHFFLLVETRMMEPHCMGRLRLHYRDALVPLLLNDNPLQSLLFSRSPLRSGAMNLSSRVEDPEDLVERLEDGCGSGRRRSGCMCGPIHNGVFC